MDVTVTRTGALVRDAKGGPGYHENASWGPGLGREAFLEEGV